MLILIVHSFDTDRKAGKKLYDDHFTLIQQLFTSYRETDMHFVQRPFDQLGDLVVDWEHDQLHQAAQEHSIAFDRLDMIFVIGDMYILPWDPRATQVVSLIHMAKFAEKPLIGLGFGAFAAVYTFCTKGARYHILNGPHGESIDALPNFPRYSVGTGAFPSGWLDRDTGDVYTFDPRTMLWRPVCNIGMHSVSGPMTAVLDTSSTLPPYLHYHEDYNRLAPSQATAAVEATDTNALLCKSALGHPLLRALQLPSAAPHFTAHCFASWRLNRAGAFPAADEGLLLLAEGKLGPLVMTKSNNRMLLIALRPDVKNKAINNLLSTFTIRMLDEHRAAAGQRIDLSLHDFLFGRVAMGEGDYDTAMNRDRGRVKAAPLARQAIPSALANIGGPVKVDPPLIEMFLRHPPREKSARAVSTRRSSSVGRKPRLTVQNPLSARQKRLENAMVAIGYSDKHQMIAKGLEKSKKIDPFAIQKNMPQTAKDLLAGFAMNDSSVTTRRHHSPPHSTMRQFEAIFPKTTPLLLDLRYAAGSSADSPRVGGGLSLSTRLSSMDIDNNNNNIVANGISMNYDGNQERAISVRPFSNKGGGFDSPIPSPRHATFVVPTNNSDESQDGRELDSETANMIKSGATNVVPRIEHWVKVFTLTPSTALASDSQRNAGRSVNTTSSRKQQHHYQPAPPSTGATPSSKKASARGNRGVFHLYTPRTAQAIMNEQMANFLPVNHPDLAFDAAYNNDNEDDNMNRSGSGLDEESTMQSLRQNTFSSNNHSSYSGEDHFYDRSDGEAEEEREEGVVKVIIPRSPLATSNFKTLTKRFQAMDKQAEEVYQSQFTVPFLSPGEAFLKQQAAARKISLAGEFRVHFGKGNSALQLRKEGAIRPHGPFPEHPGFVVPKETTAKDWTYMQSRAQPDKWVGVDGWHK